MKLGKLLIPWLMGLLMVALASPSAQAYSGYYYVIPTTFALRECAAYECDTLLTANQGDRVEILERTSTGWSRVRMVDRSAICWIPSTLLSYSPDTRSKPPLPYYVNSNGVTIRAHPTPDAAPLLTLNFNDPVEMLGVGTSGWAQVRDLRSNTIGWLPPRYLSSNPATYPRRRAPARKAAPKEDKAPEETSKQPSAM